MSDQQFRQIDNFKPKKAMIFYKCGEEPYVEVRDIDEDGKLLQGEPATLNALGFLKELTMSGDHFKTITVDIRPNKFFWLDTTRNREIIIWTNKPQIRTFEIGKDKVNYFCPATIWVYDSGVYKVYAYKKFRHFETRLYRLATPNVDQDGSICWGNVKMEKPGSLRQLKKIPELFWQSEFNNHLMGGIPCENQNYLDFYKLGEQEQYDAHIVQYKKLKELIRAFN